jgi:hypothetical protein
MTVQEKIMMNYKKSMLAAALFTVAGIALAADVKVSLSGANEVPPVTTSATGDGTISVATMAPSAAA